MYYRLPGLEIDDLLHYESYESRHVVVWYQGLLYQLDVFDAKNKQLSESCLEKLLQEIINDANKHKGN